MSEVVVLRPTHRRIRLLGLPLLLLAVVAMFVAGARRADSLSCDKTFVGLTGGDWMDGGNWSPAGVPGPTENVCASDLVALSGSTTVAAVDLDGGLDQNFGTLTLASAAEVSTINGLDAATQVKVINRLELSGTNSLGFGETLMGPGTIAVNSGASLTIQADSRLGDPAEFAATTLENAGTLNFAGGNYFFHDDTHVVNSGTFNLPSGGTLRWFSPLFPNPEPSIVNEVGGTIDAGTTTRIELPFENDGDVAVATTVRLVWPDGLNEDDGVFTTADASAVVEVWGNRSFTNATPVVGDGLLDTTVFFDAGLDFAGSTVDRLTLRRGSTTGNLTVTGLLQLGVSADGFAAVNLTGGGTTTVASGATVAFGSDDFTSIKDGHVLLSQAPVTIPAAGLGLCGTSEVRNTSTLALAGPVACSSAPHGAVQNLAGATLSVNGVSAAIAGELHNAGSILVSGGSLAAGGGTHTGAADLSGSSDSLELGGSTTATFTGSASITGAGQLRARGVSWASTASIGRLRVMPNGVFAGTATMTGDLDVDGQISGPGTITVASGAVGRFDSTTSTMSLDGGVNLVNAGTVHQPQPVDVCSSTITNEGLWNAGGQLSCSPSFTNALTGTVSLTAAWTVQGPFANAGTLALAGRTATVRGGSSTGTVTDAGGSGVFAVANTGDTFDLGNTSVPATVEVIDTGVLTGAGASADTLSLRFGGTSEAVLVVNESLTVVSSGILGGSGSTTVAAGATLPETGLHVVGSHDLILSLGAGMLVTGDLDVCGTASITVEGILAIGDLGTVSSCGLGGVDASSWTVASTGIVTLTGSADLALHGPVVVDGTLSGTYDDSLTVDGALTVGATGVVVLAENSILSSGDLDNDGTVAVGPFSSATFGTVSNSGVLVLDGLADGGLLTNPGTLEIVGGTATFDGLTNLVGSMLKDGVYQVNGALVLESAAPILTNETELTVGPDGDIRNSSASILKLRTNTATGELTIIGRELATPIFSNAGTVHVIFGYLNASSGYFQSAGLTELHGGSLSRSQFHGGRVEGFGDLGSTVRVTAATLSPGSGLGGFGSLHGDLITMTASSTYEADLAPGCSCNHDYIDSYSIGLNGTLALRGEGDPGTEVEVVIGPRTGTFSSVTGTFLAPSTNLIVDYEDFWVSVLTSPPPNVSVLPSGFQYSLTEGTSASPTPLQLDLYLSWPAAAAVSVDVVLTPGTAIAPSDFDATSVTATFAPGETVTSVMVPVVADRRFENDEEFQFSLGNLVGAAVLDPTIGTITIVDDDNLTPTVDTDGADVAPGDGECTDIFGECTLRAAVMEANALPGLQTVELVNGTTYTLSIAGRDEDLSATGDLDVLDSVRVEGNNSVIDGGGIDRVFDVRTGNLNLVNVQVLGGSSVVFGADAGHGGAVRVGTTASADLLGVVVTGSAAGSGGGVAVFGVADLSYSDVTASAAGIDGGGVFGAGGSTVTLLNTGLLDNDAVQLGGGLAAEAGAIVTIDSSQVRENRAMLGGGGLSIRTGATLDLVDTVVQENYGHVYGGGIHLREADADISRSAILSNSTLLYAGGIVHLIGALTIADTTIDGNTAAGGGGILTGYATLDITRSTISNNTALVKAGGIGSGSEVSVENSTITGNTSPIGAGFYNEEDLPAFFRGHATFHSVTFGENTGPGFTGIGGSTLTVTNSLFAPQAGGAPTCVLGIPAVSGGYNLTADTSCGFADPEDLVGDAELGTLQTQGGYTATQLPEFWAIDTGGACLAEDQRGYSRPQGLGCDRGAVEQ